MARGAVYVQGSARGRDQGWADGMRVNAYVCSQACGGAELREKVSRPSRRWLWCSRRDSGRVDDDSEVAAIKEQVRVGVQLVARFLAVLAIAVVPREAIVARRALCAGVPVARGGKRRPQSSQFPPVGRAVHPHGVAHVARRGLDVMGGGEEFGGLDTGHEEEPGQHHEGGEGAAHVLGWQHKNARSRLVASEEADERESYSF